MKKAATKIVHYTFIHSVLEAAARDFPMHVVDDDGVWHYALPDGAEGIRVYRVSVDWWNPYQHSWSTNLYPGGDSSLGDTLEAWLSILETGHQISAHTAAQAAIAEASGRPLVGDHKGRLSVIPGDYECDAQLEPGNNLSAIIQWAQFDLTGDMTQGGYGGYVRVTAHTQIET